MAGKKYQRRCEMKPIKPIYIKLIVIAIVIWIIGTTVFITDLYLKVGKIEHDLVHASFGHSGH